MSSFEEEQNGAQVVTTQTDDHKSSENQREEGRLSTLSTLSGATLTAAPGRIWHVGSKTAQDSESTEKSEECEMANDEPTITTKHEATIIEKEEPLDQQHEPSYTDRQIITYMERHNQKAPPTTRISQVSTSASTDSKYSLTEKDLECGGTQALTASWVNKNAAEAHARELSISSLKNNGTTRSLSSFNIPLPPERQSKLTRGMRHTIFNVYVRLFSIVFIGNMIAFIYLLSKTSSIMDVRISDLATAASANFTVAILIRQDYISNALYHVCWRIPHSVRLRTRRVFAKVYEQGGVHSGAAIAGSVWFLLLTVVITIFYVKKAMTSIPILTFTYILIAILATIIVFTHPGWRSEQVQKVGPDGPAGKKERSSPGHNRFEKSHRFGGWAAIAIFWVEAMLLIDQTRKANNTSFAFEMIHLPTFWFLAIITVHLVLPWLMLRKWTFHAKQLTGHAIQLSFDHTLAPLSGLAISESPLLEWHPFATFPKVDGTPGTSMIVSAAGDWTKRNVANPKKQYWVKGMPKTGVLSMALVFKKVLVVTTGSGIGPCLSLMLETSKIKKTEVCGVLWMANDPLRTYGDEILDKVFETTKDAVIVDSGFHRKKLGMQLTAKEHLIPMAYNLYMESGAEAVFIIGSKDVTYEIVNGLETRGVPAYGPIWDS